MLTQDELDEYYNRLGLGQVAVDWIKNMRANGPSRLVQGGLKNVISHFPSRKMERTIQSESRTNELANVILFENDPLVLEFWDQPPPLKLTYKLESGRNHSHWATPDFFVLENAGCGFIECKKEEDLIELSKRTPELFQRRPDGSWSCPPGEKAATEFGFFFRVVSSATLNPHLITNLTFLKSYFEEGDFSVSEKAKQAVLKVVNNNPGILIPELREKCPEASADDVNALIAAGAIYVDLEAGPLTSPERLRIFRDPALARAIKILDSASANHQVGQECPLFEGLELKWGDQQFQVIRFTEQRVLLHSDRQDREVHSETIRQLVATGEIQCLNVPPSVSLQTRAVEETLRPCTQEAIEKGLRRAEILKTPELLAKIPQRTRERWRAKIRMAEAQFSSESYGWIGLIPHHFKSGREPMKLPPEIVEVLEAAFKEYDKASAINFQSFWLLAVGEAEKRNLRHQLCCDKTGRAWLRQRSTQKTLENREGKIVATAKSAPLPIEDGWEPCGKWPWDRALIDHTKADVELKIQGTNRTRRVWLSVMIDGFSRKVLAFILDFNPPSRKTLMHLLRECVRRHRRLPTTIVLDNGKEFKSVYFEKLLAMFFVRPDFRPPHNPRFGAQIERWFHTANKRVFHQLLGNTKAMRNVRTVTKAINPKKLAGWTLELLHEGFEEFCYETYNVTKHSSLGCAPDDKFNAGQEAMGTKHGNPVENFQLFVLASMLTTPKGKAIVGRQGISVFNFDYWHPKMATHVGRPLLVRYDPCNIARVWVFIDREWVCAKCGIHTLIDGMSQKQRELAGKALVEEQRMRGEREDTSERKMAQFLMSMKGKEAILEQKQMDDALKDCLKNREDVSLPPAPEVEPAPEQHQSTPKSTSPKFLKKPKKLKTYLVEQ